MVTILVVGLIAWAISGAVEDTIRSARGDTPRTERRGLRGYLDDRFQALADHHHAVANSGMLTAWDARLARKHFARTKALKLAGLATDEEVARAKAEHKHRLGFIAKGIDPDSMPPLFPKRDMVWEPEPSTDEPLAAEPEMAPEPPGQQEPGTTIDDHYDTNADVLSDPAPGLSVDAVVHRGPDDLWTALDQTTATRPDPGPQGAWSPFETDSNTDTKETHVVNAREITSPAAVKQFHDDLKAVIDATARTADTLEGRAAELSARAAEVAGNISATEHAAADMRRLGMHDASVAAEALMETQRAIFDALTADAQANRDHAATITDQAQAAQRQLSVILLAHNWQLSVQDARVAAGRGNLAHDAFLDND